MNFRVIYALILRYIFLYTRTPVRFIEMIFWPFVDLLLWGFLTQFLQKSSTQGVQLGAFLLGGMILWDIMFRSQQGVAISFLEDVWTKNLLNIFAAPVRTREYLAATFGVGLLRIFVTASLLIVLAQVAYAFNLFSFGFAVVPLLANLLLFGWSLGMVSTALILRWGQAAEGLAWAVPFMIQPLACVFYPLNSLPGWLQPIAKLLPCSYAFEGMRAVINTNSFAWHEFCYSLVLNAIWFLAASVLFLKTLNHIRQGGALAKFTGQ